MSLPRARRSPNDVLNGIPASSYERIIPLFKQVELLYGQILYEPGQTMGYVYFPLDCVVSLLTEVDGDRRTEVGMVGHEGMLGAPLILGVSASAVRALVQGSGAALRMSAAQFLVNLEAETVLRRALQHYLHGLMCQVAQTAACNRFHTTDARLARWLLMTSDRLRTHRFYLTQEFLAQMLGMRRAGVTVAAHAMEKLGLIHYSRGNISIRDRARLEGICCTCYEVVNKLQRPMPKARSGLSPRRA